MPAPPSSTVPDASALESPTAENVASDAERIVVTGCGVYSAIGTSPETFAETLRAGQSGVGRIEMMDPDLLVDAYVGEVWDYAPEDHFSAREEWKIDRATQMAILAAQQAAERAGLDDGGVSPERRGLIVGMGGSVQYDNMHVSLSRELNPTRHLSRFFARAVPRMQTDMVAHRLDVCGPRVTYSIASAATGLALEHAANLLRSGRADAVLVGGAETLSILNVLGMSALGVVGEKPSSPFSGTPGISFGEAAAFTVLETLEHARARGAEVHVEVQGVNVTADAYDTISNDPSGAGLHLAMERALDDAGLGPEQIDWIKASGTGNRQQDVLETAAIQTLYDDHDADLPPTTSLEGTYGHVNGVSSVLGLIASIHAHEGAFMPPTANFDAARSGCELNHVGSETRHDVSVDRFLINGIAFGGINSTVVGGPVDNGAVPAPHPTDDVVVTGCGLISPVGHGMDAFLDALRQGETGLDTLEGRVDDVRATHAGFVDLNVREIAPTLSVRRLNTLSTYALTATSLAFDDAGMRPGDVDGARIGVLAGLSRGPLEAFAKILRLAFSGRQSSMVGKMLLEMGRFSVATRLAETFDLRGYAGSMDEGISGGLHALAHGYEHLRQHPSLDALVVVSADAMIDLFVQFYDKSGALSPDEFHPYGDASTARGMTLGEGSVAVVLERAASAEKRGATPLARVAGAGFATESSRPFAASDDGDGIYRAATGALADADTDAGDVDVVYGHGRGAPAYDRAEIEAMRRVFDAPVDAGCVNGNTGVAEAASGLFSIAAGLGSLRHGEVYPLVTDGAPASTGPLAFDTDLRTRDVETILAAGSTESGSSAAVVLQAP